MKVFKTVFFWTVSISVIFLFAYFCFSVERWFNWKFYYQDQVYEQVKKIEKRINHLDAKQRSLQVSLKELEQNQREFPKFRHDLSSFPYATTDPPLWWVINPPLWYSTTNYPVIKQDPLALTNWNNFWKENSL